MPPSLLPSDQYNVDTLTWVRTKVQEGEAILRQEPTFRDIDGNISYVMGDQLQRRPAALSSIKDNLVKKAVAETVAALTDIHPLFGFQTFNSAFESQQAVLDKLTRAWWVNNYTDLRLADVIRLAATTGVGYAEINWETSLSGGYGDLVMTAIDPRDVLPINPKFDFSIQSWGGVIIRSMEFIENLEQRYGVRAAGLTPDRGAQSWSGKMWGSPRPGPIITPSTVDMLNAKQGHNLPATVPAKELYKIYFKDNRSHTGPTPITMGEPGTNWAYTVYPVGWVMPDGKRVAEKRTRLYPRGRLIVATRDRILYDGPNPYWHGMFPIAKLSLDPWPWSLLGGSLVSDLRSLQDGINDIVNGYMDHVKKILRPDIIGDKNAVPQAVWNRIDTRLPGNKILQNPSAGKGVELLIPEALPGDVQEMLVYLVGEVDKLSGTANLQALSQLNQAPGADSIERLQEALSPILRLKGRLLEVFLREIGEMVKAGFFQFYTLPRRVAVLGEQGVDLHDFDFDPGSLIPAMGKDDPGYMEELDASNSVSDRAIFHHQNFTFHITPNSLLAMSQLSRKLTYLQLWRGGLMDPWSLWEVLEVPNAGQPPDGAQTITERLQAAAMLGLSGSVSPAGRKASGQEAPQQQQKVDENGDPRVVMSESG